jgi:hypothetical protein
VGTRRSDVLAKLRACERPLLGKGTLDDFHAAVGKTPDNAQLGEAPGVAGKERRRRQRL